MNFVPAYNKLSSHWLEKKIREAERLFAECTLCPRECRALRMPAKGERAKTGACGADDTVKIASYGPHFGEESPLVGSGGSGTIFFSHCSLRCVYCQNCDISWEGNGYEVSVRDLAVIMLRLQARGCHNVNLVTPTHYVFHILQALASARESGLHVPLVYNCGGYESLKTLKILDGVVDIYMPDVKYDDPVTAEKLSGVGDYPAVVRETLKEMYRQVGELKLDERGVALRGLIVRHLVLPGNLAGTREIMKFIARELSPNVFVNLMDQYRPMHLARRYPPLEKRVSPEEYDRALGWAEEAGIEPRE